MASVPFNNLITFSRGSNATLTGPDGLIQWAPNNLLTFSEQFDNAAWSKVNATITANTIAAPDGTTTADRLVNTGLWGLDQAATLVAGIRYVISVWVKSGGTGKDTFILYGDGTQASGTLTATSSWVRVEHSFVATVSGARGNGIFRDSSNNPVDIYLWGAQLELGSAATTYNSTTVKNLLGFSESFDNAAWTKTRVSIVTGAQANPVNGAFNAQKLMESTAAGTHPASLTFTSTAIPYTLSIYAKAAERNWVYISHLTTANAFASFDLSTGVIGTVASAATATIQDLGNGWYRCAISFTATAGSGPVAFYPATADGINSYTGDGNSGVYIYGAQLSDSASLDPYVPTPAAAPSSTAYYGPRFDYDPVTLQPKGLLVEEARTNLALYSEQFDNAAWTKSGATITANATVSPDGTTNADKLVENTSTGVHVLTQNVNMTSGVSYTFTVFAKAAERSRLFFERSNATLTSYTALVDLAGGTVVSTTGTVTASITAVGSDWYRISLTVLAAATASGGVQVDLVSTGSTVNYTGNGTSGVFLYGAQLEAGAFATSYIPTVASTVTRSADVATINGSLFSQWYGRSEGTFVAGFDMAGGSAAFANNRAVLVARESATSSHNIYNGSGQVTGWTVVSGVDQAFLTTGALAADTVTNMAYAYKANDFAASRNGGTVATDTSGTLPSPTVLGICSNSANSLFLSGHIRSIDYIPARAADFQLQALTL